MSRSRHKCCISIQKNEEKPVWVRAKAKATLEKCIEKLNAAGRTAIDLERVRITLDTAEFPRELLSERLDTVRLVLCLFGILYLQGELTGMKTSQARF